MHVTVKKCCVQFRFCIFDSSLPRLLLHSVLSCPASFQFIVECHGNTLLPQFLGMYRLTVDGVETYMVVTRNVFSHRLTVHRKYDLKVGYVGYCICLILDGWIRFSQRGRTQDLIIAAKCFKVLTYIDCTLILSYHTDKSGSHARIPHYTCNHTLNEPCVKVMRYIHKQYMTST